MNKREPEIETLDTLDGERGIPSVSGHQRVSPMRAIAVLFVFVVLAVTGFIFWRSHVKNAAAEADAPVQKDIQQSTTQARTFHLPPPEKPPAPPAPVDAQKGVVAPVASGTANAGTKPGMGGGAGAGGSSAAAEPAFTRTPPNATMMVSDDTNALAGAAPGAPAIDVAALAGSQSPLGAMLSGTTTAPKGASVLKDRDYLIPKGKNIDCVLNRRLDSTVPGMTSCIVTQDIYGDTGKVLLVERGSTVDGEYQANMKQGMARIFVLYTRIRTPSGVVVDLSSPGTDALGGAGVPGYVDNHFWQRFGGAMMLSIVQDVVAGASQKLAGQGQTISLGNTSDASETMAAEALRSTINIPPTLYKNQGERVAIYVARDLNFRSVYDLRSE